MSALQYFMYTIQHQSLINVAQAGEESESPASNGDSEAEVEDLDAPGVLVEGDDGSDEEYMFHITKADHWAQYVPTIDVKGKHV